MKHQDLTVQQIKTSLTINVYEIHARIALEVGDLPEFNQCQTQLHELYKELPDLGHPMEFTSYKILYLALQGKYSSLSSVFAGLSQQVRGHPDVSFAIKICEALHTSNFARFFRLYTKAPNMSGHMLDCIAESVRDQALLIICKSYFPDVLVDSVSETLGFGTDLYSCLEYFSKKGVVCLENDTVIDTRATLAALQISS
eukprot:c32391_g1_i1.p1 GENE.c32391_g1_i1~~c32391_g1_i1.p1  ORF type:complete len:199 (+),score=59.23 c32391_g1_i1:1-597(+)